jgi:hypothetical protein
MKHGIRCRGWVTALLLAQLALLPAPVATADSAPATLYAAADESESTNPTFGEYEIKAGFIYRFLSFVSWPDNLPNDGTITIGILGRNPFGNAFKSIEGSTVNDRVVQIRLLSGNADITELKSCQVLYLSSSLEKRQQDILKAIGNHPILTVGDSRGFIDNGGMIGFVRRDRDRVGIEINVSATGRAGLTIRSMLKRIAVRIITEHQSAKENSFAYLK